MSPKKASFKINQGKRGCSIPEAKCIDFTVLHRIFQVQMTSVGVMDGDFLQQGSREDGATLS